jgi:hypothetical protein
VMPNDLQGLQLVVAVEFRQSISKLRISHQD